MLAAAKAMMQTLDKYPSFADWLHIRAESITDTDLAP
jgi:hypothetical protein